MTPYEENEIRNYYLSLIGDSKLSFHGIIDKIYRELAVEYGSLMDYSPAVIKKTLYYPNQNQKIDSIENKMVFSVGRLSENDIMQNNMGVSRINCLVFIYQNRLTILDSWSLNGTICTNMNTGQEFKTYSGRRRIITFPRNDEIMIRTHGGNIIINPKRCLKCEVGPRQVILSCGHLEICYPCYQQIKNNSDSDELCSKCIFPICDLLGKGVKIFLPIDQLDFSDKGVSFDSVNYPSPPDPLSSSSLSSSSSSSSLPNFYDHSSYSNLINPWQEPISSSFSSSSGSEINISQLSGSALPSPILVRGSEGLNKRKRSQKKTNLSQPTKKTKLSKPLRISKSNSLPQEKTYQKGKIIKRSLSEDSCLTGIFVRGVLHCRVSPWGNISSNNFSAISRSLSSPSRIAEQKI
uniref:C3HC4 type zinc finger protein n=1 Tax=Pithovirus LCPAC202 TaxID=2506592 RepID=A0A481Z938_9VIRU|nr:MAG: C3HC4 type zinc finger protein [Pithovirus LCPAC202]